MTHLLALLLALAPLAASASERDVEAAAQAALADVWPDAEVRVVRLSAGAAAAAPPIRVRFADGRPQGRASATVEARVDGVWAPAGWAYLEVTVYRTGLVVTRGLDRGAAVAGAVEARRVEAVPGLLSPDRLVEGGTAARSLRAGTVLTARLVRAPSAVDVGSPLRVRYTRGALTVALACQARERGAVGETVRATCPDAAAYRVRLTGPGEGTWAATLSR